MGKRHLIDELHFATELDQAATAQAPWSDWPDFCRNRLLGVIDKVFDEFSPHGATTLRLDTLEVDLGPLSSTLSAEELEKHLERILRESLRDSLRNEGQGAVTAEEQSVPGERSEQATLEFYLQHGLPPWHADSTAPYPFQATLLEQAKHNGQRLKTILCSSGLALERCIRQSTDATLSELLALLAPDATSSVATTLPSPADQAEAWESRYHTWERSFQQAFAKGSIETPARQTAPASAAARPSSNNPPDDARRADDDTDVQSHRQNTEAASTASTLPPVEQPIRQASTSHPAETSMHPPRPHPASSTWAVGTSAERAENRLPPAAQSGITTKAAQAIAGQAQTASASAGTAPIIGPAARQVAKPDLTKTATPAGSHLPSSIGAAANGRPTPKMAIPGQDSADQSRKATAPAHTTQVATPATLRQAANAGATEIAKLAGRRGTASTSTNADSTPTPEATIPDQAPTDQSRTVSAPANTIQGASPAARLQVAAPSLRKTANPTGSLAPSNLRAAFDSALTQDASIPGQTAANQSRKAGVPADTTQSAKPTTLHRVADAGIMEIANPAENLCTSSASATAGSTSKQGTAILGQALARPSLTASAPTDMAQGTKPAPRRTGSLSTSSIGTVLNSPPLPETAIPDPTPAKQSRKVAEPADTMHTVNPATLHQAADAGIADVASPTRSPGTSPTHTNADSASILKAAIPGAISTNQSSKAATSADMQQGNRPLAQHQVAEPSLAEIAASTRSLSPSSSAAAFDREPRPAITIPGQTSAGQSSNEAAPADTIQAANPARLRPIADAGVTETAIPNERPATSAIDSAPAPETAIPNQASRELSRTASAPAKQMQDTRQENLLQVAESKQTETVIPDRSPAPSCTGSVANRSPMPETAISAHVSTGQIPPASALGDATPGTAPVVSHQAADIGVTGTSGPDASADSAPSPKTAIFGQASAGPSLAASASTEAMRHAAKTGLTEPTIPTGCLAPSGSATFTNSVLESAKAIPDQAIAGQARRVSVPESAPPTAIPSALLQAAETSSTETFSPLMPLGRSSDGTTADRLAAHENPITSQLPIPSTPAGPARRSGPTTAVARPAGTRLPGDAPHTSSSELPVRRTISPEPPIPDQTAGLTPPSTLPVPRADACGQPDSGDGTAEPPREEEDNAPSTVPGMPPTSHARPIASDLSGMPEAAEQSTTYWRSQVLARVHGEFARAIERHAGQAANPARYYRRLLTALTADAPIDLAAFAAQSDDPGDKHGTPASGTTAGKKTMANDAPEAQAEPLAPSRLTADWIEPLLASGSSALGLVVQPLLADPGKLSGLLEIWPDELFGRVFAQLRTPDFDRLLPYAEAMSEACPSITGDHKRRLKWQALVDALFPHPRYGATADFVVAYAERLAAASTEGENFRTALCANLTGNPDRQRVEQYLRYWLLGSRAPLLPAGPTEINPAAIVPGSGLVIGNAGQVLAAPYLPRLFDMLGLLDKGRFAGPAEARRACHLLQFMVDPQSEAAEHQLLLNKLLCGLDMRQPLDAGIAVSDSEKALIEGLLQGIISNWGALGSTSIAGLREAFLQRPGALAYRDEAWQLKVEKKTLDILMERLPWSFSIIRHSWMKQAVMVEWL